MDHGRRGTPRRPPLARARLRHPTGAGTVRADNPRLTVREVATPRQPLRVIVDSRLETPASARILEGGNVLIFAGMAGRVPAGAEVMVLPNETRKRTCHGCWRALRRGVNELHVEAGFG